MRVAEGVREGGGGWVKVVMAGEAEGGGVGGKEKVNEDFFYKFMTVSPNSLQFTGV